MLDTKTFSMRIEDIACDKNIPYMDAVVDYCEKHGMEVEVAAKLLNSKIKQTIASEASDLNMMKEKINKLPV